MSLAHSSEPRSDRVFRLYPTCKLVRGGAYSAVYDLERRQLYRFDSAYFDLFALAEAGIGVDMLDALNPRPRANCAKAIAFLEEREVGRYLDACSAACLTPLPESWDSPHTILSALIDVGSQQHDWSLLIAKLDRLQTRCLQIRCFEGLIDLTTAKWLLDELAGKRITRVELLVKWAPCWADVDWWGLFDGYRNLQRVRVHSAPRDEELTGLDASDLPLRQVRFEKIPVDGSASCGAITEGSLSIPSASLYSELRAFNGCLNRKVSVRADGEICNCPSMRATFGSDLGKLEEIVASEKFQRPWRIAKDSISICRGCEFRYVCTDCRAYLESDVSTEKPARCRYDPLTGRWSEPS